MDSKTPPETRVYTLPPFDEVVRMDSRASVNKTWESCCFRVDRACVMFIVQTLIGSGLLTFCGYRLSTETNCDKASPYWGLIGTLCGFFFRTMSAGKKETPSI